MEIDRGFVTVNEAALHFGATPYAVRQWIRRGQLRAMRFGSRGTWRIPVAALKDVDPAMTGPDVEATHAEPDGGVGTG